jgi:hypothetical protein
VFYDTILEGGGLWYLDGDFRATTTKIFATGYTSTGIPTPTMKHQKAQTQNHFIVHL